MNRRKTLFLIVISVIAAFLIYLIGPGDVFVNGFNCSPIAYEQIPKENILNSFIGKSGI